MIIFGGEASVSRPVKRPRLNHTRLSTWEEKSQISLFPSPVLRTPNITDFGGDTARSSLLAAQLTADNPADISFKIEEAPLVAQGSEGYFA